MSLAMLTHWSPIRSMFLMTCSSAATSRRSPATGDCSASRESTPWCTSRYRPSSRSSSTTTNCASSTSRCSSASITRSSCSTTRSSPPSAAASSCWSSSWKCCRVIGTTRLAELPGDVLLGAGVAGVAEDLLRRRVLDQLAEEHERGRVRHTGGLLHVVRDDHDRVALLQVLDEVLDLERRDRVEGGAGLVHEDYVGLDRDRARDAKALLLAAREADAGLVEAVLDLVPQAGADQRLLDALAHVDALDARELQARRDVLEDRHRREGVRLLEHHPDRAADGDDVDVGRVDVEVVEQDLALGVRAGDLLVHPVDAPHERRLAAAGRADHRRHLVGRVLEVDALDGVGIAVVGVDAAQADARRGRVRGRRPADGARRKLHRRPAPRGVGRFVSWGGHRGLRVSGHAASLLLRWIRRAIRVRSTTITTSVSPAPHARWTSRSCAWPTSLKICSGSEFIRWLTSVCAPRTNAAVNSSGAVSPAARATASSDPVTMPGSAVGSTIRKITFQRGAPRASAASRRESGTRFRTTSAERVTIGSISSASATEPFQAANVPPTFVTTRTM